jgi:hypothetical protein
VQNEGRVEVYRMRRVGGEEHRMMVGVCVQNEEG